MPEDYVEKVVALAHPLNPVEQPTPVDWERAEEEIGLLFPSDYKALVSRLGTGSFGAGLYLRNPCASSSYNRLSHEALLSYRQISGKVAEDSQVVLYPEPKGLVVIGGIDRQDFLLNPNSTGKRLSKLIWWDLDRERATAIGMPVSRFIHDLYTKKIKKEWAEELCDYFWRDKTLPFFSAWQER